MTVSAAGKDKIKLRGVSRAVYKKMGRAIYDYRMLSDGDRILVGVSGGTDSLALLELLKMRRGKIPLSYEFIACHVSTDFLSLDKNILCDYFRSKGIKFILRELKLEPEEVNCFWCSWNRRKILFTAAREMGCNKLALGHHLDDISETILMNLFYVGEVSAMKPNLDVFGGEIGIIRPFCYLTKEEVNEFSLQQGLPSISCECPYGKGSRREFVKKIIKEAEKKCPYVKKNIFNALKKVKSEYLL